MWKQYVAESYKVQENDETGQIVEYYDIQLWDIETWHLWMHIRC